MKKIISLCILLTACSSGEEITENKELEAKLVGEWRNVSMKLEMRTFKNSDSTRIVNVNEGTWEQKMKIRPIRTFYRADRTYNSEHWNLNDSLIFNPAGHWKIMGDTLIMADTFPIRGKEYKYRIAMEQDFAAFKGIEDMDGDGQADDYYLGVQRKFNPNRKPGQNWEPMEKEGGK